MNREEFDRWCERGILGLVLVILAFGPLASGAVRIQEFLVLQTLTVGVMALWGVRLWLNERPQLLWPPVCWAVLAFAVYAVVRYRTCEIEYVGRLELLRILVYVFLFLAILNNLHRQECTQVISYTMIFLATAVCFCAIWQFLTRSNLVPSLSATVEWLMFPHKTWYFSKPYAHRASGTYISPNHVAGLLEMLLPLTLAYTLTGRGKPLTKIVLGYCALVLVAGIGVTVSRGSWVATGVALLVFFAVLTIHRTYRLPSVLMLIVVVAGSSFFVVRTAFFKERFQNAFASGRLELNVRYDLWDSTVRMWRDHFWLGVGPGHYDYRFRAYRPVQVQLRADRAHNEYLNVLADWGVLGGVIIATALASLAVGFWNTVRHVRRTEVEFSTNHSNKFAFVLGSGIAILALLVHSLVDFNLHIPANALLAVALMALLSGHLRFTSDRYWFRARWLSRLLLTTGLLLAAGYLSLQTWRLGREYLWLERAELAKFEAQSVYSAAEIEARERAHAIEPMNFENTFEIGEAFRARAFEGGEDYAEQAAKAMEWYARGMRLQPFDGYNHLRYGMCLDKIDRFEEAAPYFNRAEELDPNGYYTLASIGWHHVQTGNYAAARPWLERSLRLQRKENNIATSYLEIANRKLLDTATNQSRLLLR